MIAPLVVPPAAQIEAYQGRHRESVIALWQQIFRKANQRLFQRDIDIAVRKDPELFTVALAGDQLIGTCMGATDNHRAWVYYLSVMSEWRRQGVATLLLHNAESQFRARGISQVGLNVHNRSYAAQMFYRKLGYFHEEVQCMGKRLG